jgi:hypothetical protein
MAALKDVHYVNNILKSMGASVRTGNFMLENPVTQDMQNAGRTILSIQLIRSY